MLVPKSPPSSPYFCSPRKGRHIEVVVDGVESTKGVEYSDGRIYKAIRNLRNNLLQERLARDAGRLPLCDEQQNTNLVLRQLEKLLCNKQSSFIEPSSPLSSPPLSPFNKTTSAAGDTSAVFDLLLKYNTSIPTSVELVPYHFATQLKESIDESLRVPPNQEFTITTRSFKKEPNYSIPVEEEEGQKVICWQTAADTKSNGMKQIKPTTRKQGVKEDKKKSHRHKLEKYKPNNSIELLYGGKSKKRTKQKRRGGAPSVDCKRHEKDLLREVVEEVNLPIQKHSFLRTKGDLITYPNSGVVDVVTNSNHNDHNDHISPIHSSKSLFLQSKDLLRSEYHRKRNRGINLIEELLANISFNNSNYSLSVINEAADYLGTLFKKKGMYSHLSNIEILLLYLYCVGGCPLFSSGGMYSEINCAMLTLDPLLCLKWCCSITTLISIASKRLASQHKVKIEVPSSLVFQDKVIFCQTTRSVSSQSEQQASTYITINTDIGLPISCFTHKDDDWLLPFLTEVEVADIQPTRQVFGFKATGLILKAIDGHKDLIEMAEIDSRRQSIWLDRKFEMRNEIRRAAMNAKMIKTFKNRVAIGIQELVQSESREWNLIENNFKSGRLQLLNKGWSGSALRVTSSSPTVPVIAVMVFDAIGDKINTSINPLMVPLSRSFRVSSIQIHLSMPYQITSGSQCDVTVFGNRNGFFSSLRTVRISNNQQSVDIDLSGHGRNGLPSSHVFIPSSPS